MISRNLMNFYTSVIAKSSLFHSLASIRALDLLEPVMRSAVQAILADAKGLGLPFMVVETYRSCERQEALFEQHATSLRTVGVHHYGLACDFAKDVGGEPSWKGDFSLLGVLARKHGLVWGGTWTHPCDPDHVQRCAVDDQDRLFAGTWYPDAAYQPF
jgi:hypothetical protein